jgi:2-keto-3-deoxy-L-rhamnonate aldolase RhmA
MKNAFTALLQKSTDKPANARAIPLGTWIMSASPMIAEATACAGFDWALLDMEHTPIDMMGLVHLLQSLHSGSLMRHSGAPDGVQIEPIVPIVRLPWNDSVMVKRVMDAGARYLMFPFVENAEQAQQAAASMRYTPEGIRGMAAMGRASHFGTIPNYFKLANALASCIVQIESPQAVSQIDAIARTSGVDALFIGPGDLSGAMGHVGDLLHPEVLALTQEAVTACHRAGKPIGTVGATPQALQTYREMGFDFLACASDLGLLMRSYQSNLQEIEKLFSASSKDAQNASSDSNTANAQVASSSAY